MGGINIYYDNSDIKSIFFLLKMPDINKINSFNFFISALFAHLSILFS